MDLHRGEILKAILRESGYPFKTLAKRLGISRNTIYNKFKEHDLSYEFVVHVGELIRYDFSYAYPKIKALKYHGGKNQCAAELWWLERKYAQLLEKHDKLLRFLTKMATDYHQEELKEDMEKFSGAAPST